MDCGATLGITGAGCRAAVSERSTKGGPGMSTPQRVETTHKAAKESRTTDGDTRRQVMLLLLKDGPVTASHLGERRRPVTRGAAGSGSGRGRPAKHFRLTDRGRAQFGHAYDDLASDALTALRDVGGSEAVKRFAKVRFGRLVADVRPLVEEGESVEDVARKLAEVLDEHGYAATVDRAGQGVQICQHHCPVSHVAAEHPELCEAEQEVFSALLGKHVQPLASIAGGHGICTTNIPLTPVNTNTERSES